LKTWLYLWGKPGLGRGEKKEKEGKGLFYSTFDGVAVVQ
jgi:hypothetical protein